MVNIIIKDKLLNKIEILASRNNKNTTDFINETLEKALNEEYINGVPLEDIAEELGLTVGGLKKQLEEAEAEESILLDVDNLEKELGL
ncbi:MAG: hypothetical protein LBD03_00815 [Methanobrevibacter sp.]|jgi:hypothetical protein|nr:hypothetical protein [Candidatus Methanovirga procula]